jgi:hypothetical protein
MLAMFLTTLILRRALPRRLFLLGPFTALEKGLNSMFKLPDAPTQLSDFRAELSVFGLKLGNP